MNSREKGKRGERELAGELRRHGYDARRGQQYCGANGDADVVGLSGLHIECKRVERLVPFPVSWTVKMKKKQKETQDILSYHTQAAGCSDKARAKASGGRQPIEECGRTGL